MKLFVCFFLLLVNAIAAPFKVGVTAGPHTQIMEKVKEVAAKEGLEVKIIEFNDFILPNQALNQKELDANCYQHKPFLNEQIKSRGLKLVDIGETVLMPLRAYSKKIKDINLLRNKAVIAIPNDPTNEGRALLLLKKAGLIELRDNENPSVADISSNPKQLKILEVEAPQLPRTLDDVDLCIINTDWVLLAGLDPALSLIQEDAKNPYVNIIVVRAEDKERADVKVFLKAYFSDAVKTYIRETFKGAVVPAW